MMALTAVSRLVPSSSMPPMMSLASSLRGVAVVTVSLLLTDRAMLGLMSRVTTESAALACWKREMPKMLPATMARAAAAERGAIQRRLLELVFIEITVPFCSSQAERMASN